MLEIFALIYFSKKIRTIAKTKNIKASKWIWRLILTWFSVEIITIILFLTLFGKKIAGNFLLAAIPAIIFAIISATYIIKMLENESKN